jgi:hypothetical protein
MTTADELARLAEHLDQVPSLHEVFGAQPQVLLVPSPPGAADKRMLFVGLFLAEHALTRENLASVCSRTITELNAAKSFDKGVGLEIMVCVARGVTAERVLRLQVQSSALGQAELMTVDDLAKTAPAAGIKCALFRRALP